jgi:hypothetical protein
MSNGLSVNGVRMNGVRMNGVRMNGLSFNGLTQEQSLKVLGYMVSCALPPPTSPSDGFTIYLDDGPHTFFGDLGLAPSLGADSLTDQGEQERLTACLMARTNAYCQHIEISMHGDGRSVDGGEATFVQSDGAFAGNIFADTPWMSVCTWQSG